ncbi:hypothetical protein BaRGS_00021261 [Batillaria attramentaria]|uniref:Uncharacterized protein n=1 Tax=Batillaria attramentaria TaxID=370345 RepID=A0ABD0KK74_9CAEN
MIFSSDTSDIRTRTLPELRYQTAERSRRDTMVTKSCAYTSRDKLAFSASCHSPLIIINRTATASAATAVSVGLTD